MKTRFTGMAKVVGFCFPLALGFGLVACGDDSSSGAGGDEISNGDGDDDGDSDDGREKAYCDLPDDGNEWVIDVVDSKSGDEVIRWKDGKAVVVSKKNYGSSCETMQKQLGGTCEDGFLVTTLNVEKYRDYSRKELREAITEHWFNCVSSSDSKSSSSGKSSTKSSSSGKSDSKSSSSSKSEPQYENPFTDLKVGECNFKIDDKTWQYVTYSDNFGLGDEYKLHYYKYKEGGSIDSTYTYTFGSNARTLCRLDGDQDSTYTNNYGAKVHFKSWCTSDGMEEFQVVKNTDQDSDREYAFNNFMTWCKAHNGIYDDESSSSSKGKSSSSEADEDESSSSVKSSSSSAKSSSSSAKSSSSSKKTEPTYPTQYGKSCKFTQEDDSWYVEDKDANYYAVYEWTGNKAKETAVQFIDCGDAETCVTMKGMVPDCNTEGHSCTCDNELLVVKSVSQEAFESKASAFIDAMYNWCGIEVEIESSSSSAVNHCAFEKTDSEWTFVSEDVTEIFTWDSNDQYTYTHIAKDTYYGDDFYEGCEDCKTAQQYCQEDADRATEETPEDEEFKYTYTCDKGVMTTTSAGKIKYGDSDERDWMFLDRCLYED